MMASACWWENSSLTIISTYLFVSKLRCITGAVETDEVDDVKGVDEGGIAFVGVPVVSDKVVNWCKGWRRAFLGRTWLLLLGMNLPTLPWFGIGHSGYLRPWRRARSFLAWNMTIVRLTRTPRRESCLLLFFDSVQYSLDCTKPAAGWVSLRIVWREAPDYTI